MSRPIICHLLGCAFFLVSDVAARAQSHCDPALMQNSAQSSGYQDRRDRCEGIYKRDVSSFGVQLVALVGASAVGDLCVPGQAVHFVWPRTAGTSGIGAVHLQVESLRRRLFYRMDANRPPGSSSFQWPPEPRCNNEVRLGATELGALATTTVTRGAKPLDVLLPVALSADPNARAGPPYRAILVPGRRIREVYVSLWHYRDDQNATRIFSERPLHMQPYPPGNQIVVELSPADVKEVGLYRLRLSVEFESGERETLDQHFFNGR